MSTEQTAHNDNASDTLQRPNKPFGKIGLVPDSADLGGGYIGCYAKDGELFAGFATVDPYAAIWRDWEADEIATALIASWNACADAGLTVAQLDAGIIKQTMSENAALKAALRTLYNTASELIESGAIIDIPDPNCSCHLSPPCGDCVDYSGPREALADVENALSIAELTLDLDPDPETDQ